MKKINILISRNFTIEPLLDEIEEKLSKKFLKPNFLISGYEDSVNEFLNPKSKFYKFKPDLILLFFNIDAYFINQKIKKTGLEQQIIFREIKENILSIVSNINKNFPIDIGICNFSNSLIKEGKKIQNSLNIFINKLCTKQTNYHLLNIEEVLSKIDYIKGQNLKYWKQSMYPFNLVQGSEVSSYLYKFIGAKNGKAHKLIILDADNTLWNGIIGENEIKDINIKKTGVEKNFYLFQKYLKELKENGIILALCSKNNLSDIKKFFKAKQKKMPLSIKDFSNLKVNWQPKSENIKKMLKELNISSENSIFVDDSKFEILEVKNTLPNLDTLLVPKLNLRINSELLKIGNFDTSSTTNEDKKRTKLYQIEEQRNQKKTKFKSPQEYIKSLKIKLTIKKNIKKNIQRLSQMTIKTNQFNTSTLRLSEKKIVSYIKDPDYLVVQCAAEDKFGDYGIIGLSIIKIQSLSKRAIVENSLFSCRALGRMIEEHFYQKIFNILKSKKFIDLDFIFIKTDKNRPAYEFFIKHNFNKKKYKNGNIIFSCDLDKKNLIKEKNIIRYN
tara:strand:+ start:6066 stop:7733 length:1668 start_codon:yes stop_codon:yes gene_type:complete